MARGTRIQPGWNGSQTTTDRGAPNNSSAVTIKYTLLVKGRWRRWSLTFKRIAKTAGKHAVKILGVMYEPIRSKGVLPCRYGN